MSELFGNTSTPRWLSPAEFSIQSEHAASGVGQAFAQGMRQGEERRQFDALQPMREQQAKTQAAAANAQINGRILKDKELQDALDDAVTFKNAQINFGKGDVTDPTFKTPKFAEAWNKWRAGTDAGQAKSRSIAEFGKKINELDGAGVAAVNDLPTNDDGSPSWQQWQEMELQKKRVDQEKSERKLQEEAAKQAIIGQRQSELESQRQEGRKEIEGQRQQGRLDLLEQKAQIAIDNAGKVLDKATFEAFKGEIHNAWSDFSKSAEEREKKIAEIKSRYKVPDTFEKPKSQERPKGEQPKPDQSGQAPKFNSADEVRFGVLQGKISREDGLKILKDQFGYQ